MDESFSTWNITRLETCCECDGLSCGQKTYWIVFKCYGLVLFYNCGKLLVNSRTVDFYYI